MDMIKLDHLQDCSINRRPFQRRSDFECGVKVSRKPHSHLLWDFLNLIQLIPKRCNFHAKSSKKYTRTRLTARVKIMSSAVAHLKPAPTLVCSRNSKMPK